MCVLCTNFLTSDCLLGRAGLDVQMWWCYFLIELVNILGITLEVFDKQGHGKGIHVFMVLDIPTEGRAWCSGRAYRL